jgi:hypothetical protein
LSLSTTCTEAPDFVRWRIKKHNVGNNVEFYDINNFEEKNICDGLFCIDVLEHLPNSSFVFKERISPLIKENGFAVLRAPWRVENVTHIAEAADDFYFNGGREYLSRNYLEYYRLCELDIGAIYRKRKTPRNT